MNRPIRPQDRGWEEAEVFRFIQELSEKCIKIYCNPKNVGGFEYVLTFCPNDQVRVTVAFCLADWQTDSDVVITNMTTLPEVEQGKGYGSQVIDIIIDWATRNKFNEVRAVQVSNPKAQNFWEKNGFIYLPEPNPTGDCVYYISY